MFEHSLKNAYIGGVYEYSYDFRNKSTSQITADGWIVVSWTPSTSSDWLKSSDGAIVLYNIGNAMTNATKITLTCSWKHWISWIAD